MPAFALLLFPPAYIIGIGRFRILGGGGGGQGLEYWGAKWGAKFPAGT